MDRAVFDGFRELIYRSAGIALGDQKDVLLASRIAKRMRVLGIETHAEFLELVLADETGHELVGLLDAISTNVTSFFREASHFDVLARSFEEWQEAGQTRFRFWSAACSTGEEVYSIAITLADAARTPGLDVKVLGTDINTDVLAHAYQAVYRPDRLASLDPRLRSTYFAPTTGGFAVKPAARRLARFARLNLAEPPFPMRGPLDAVFCRNVMIYFDDAVRARLLCEIEQLLKPGGLLFLGHAESLAGFETGLKPVVPSVFVKP